MWSSVAASGFGDRLIQLAAEPMLGVNEPEASASSISSGILFFFCLPYMLFTLVGGYLADRLPRKWIMLACDEARAAILLLAFFMAANLGQLGKIPSDHYWKVYLIMACTGAFAAIFNPSKQSTVPQIVRPRYLQPANAVLAGIALIASLLGAKVGAEILAYSIQAAIMLGAVAYGISGLFFAFLKTAPGPAAHALQRTSIVAQAVGAVSYLRHHRTVRHLVVLNILFWTAGYILYAALAALARKHYGIATDDYMATKVNLMTALGGGVLCGSLVVMWVRSRRVSSYVGMIGLIMAGTCMLLLTVNRSYSLGLVLVFANGLGGGLFMVCVDTLTQRLTPNYIRGRVFGLRSMLNTISAVAVNFTIWRVQDADLVMIPVLGVTAGVLLLVSIYGLWILMTRGPMSTRRLNAVWRTSRVLFLLWHRVRWIGRHNVPSHGPVILAGNHTAGIDPFIIATGTIRFVTWVMSSKYYFRIINPIWDVALPIVLNVEDPEIAKVRSIIQALKDGKIIGLFPEGQLQRDVRELQAFRPGIGMIARRTGATIVPIWIAGTPESKSMLVHFLRPSRSVVVFGEPYLPDPSDTKEQIVEELRRRMVALADLVDSPLSRDG
jgi:1-acyl-sn-glycerol-3-phosphate acyltransferase/predicted MFS family arabinose efflux permease